MKIRYVPLLLYLLAAAAQAQQPAYDPADPLSQNELALRLAFAGELARARIVLERAAVLDPTDVRIARNLQALTVAMDAKRPAWMAVAPSLGALLKTAPPASPVAPSTAPPEPPPPPLWTQQGAR